MRIEKRKEIVEIQEEVRIPQGDHEIILEKGDMIEVVNESSSDVSNEFRHVQDLIMKSSKKDAIEYWKDHMEQYMPQGLDTSSMASSIVFGKNLMKKYNIKEERK